MSVDAGDQETALRTQLAEFYHLVDYMGWGELIFNHISLRLPGPEHHYLVNPFGLNYREITPDNLLVVDVEGQLIGASNYPANPAGFSLHGAIHASRPDAACVAHTHSNAVSAIALKESGFTHDGFYGAQLYGNVAYHAFEGITLHADEKERMLASLGDKSVLVLRNHGVAVCGRDVPHCFMLLWTVQRAAEIQCQAGMLPGRNVPLPEQVQRRCAEAAAQLGDRGGFSDLVFAATVRKMRAERGPLWRGTDAD